MSSYYLHTFRKCIMTGCNSIEGDKISLFRLPRDITKLKTWLTNIDRLDLLEKGPQFCYINRRICALHFQPSMFTNILQNKLKRKAVPTKLQSSKSNTVLQAKSISNTKELFLDSSDVNIGANTIVLHSKLKQVDVPIKLQFPESNVPIKIESTNSADVNIDASTIVLQNELEQEAVHIKLELPESNTPLNIESTNSSDVNVGGSTSTTTETQSLEMYGDASFDNSTQTPASWSYNRPSQKALRLQITKMAKYQKHLLKQIEDLKQTKLMTSKQFLNYCQQHFSPTLYHIIKAQHDASQVTSHGNRYSNEIKQFALGLYFLSPMAYKFLSRVIHMPTKSCLLKMTKTSKIEAYLKTKCVMKALKLKVENFDEYVVLSRALNFGRHFLCE